MRFSNKQALIVGDSSGEHQNIVLLFADFSGTT